MDFFYFLQVLCSCLCFSLCINPKYLIKLCHSYEFVMSKTKRLLPYGSVWVVKRGISPFRNTPTLLHSAFYCNRLYAVKHKGSFFFFFNVF